MIEPINNGILFVFIQSVSKNSFDESTDWGFKIKSNQKTTTQSGRWGKVLAVGPTVESDIQKGTYIFIEPLMWTQGFKFDGVNVWKTDSSKVMAVCDSLPV